MSCKVKSAVFSYPHKTHNTLYEQNVELFNVKRPNA
jgi:hypothetical protein